jgi:hypothetical protein
MNNKIIIKKEDRKKKRLWSGKALVGIKEEEMQCFQGEATKPGLSPVLSELYCCSGSSFCSMSPSWDAPMCPTASIPPAIPDPEPFFGRLDNRICSSYKSKPPKREGKEGREEPFLKSTQVQLGNLPGNMTDDHIMETLPSLGK